MSCAEQHGLRPSRRSVDRSRAHASRFAAVLLSLVFTTRANAQTAIPPRATAMASAPPTASPIKAEPPAGPNMAIVGMGAGMSGTLLVTGAVFTVLPNVRTSD